MKRSYRFRLLRAIDENGGRRDAPLSRETVLVSNGRVRPQENRNGEKKKKKSFTYFTYFCVEYVRCLRACVPLGGRFPEEMGRRDCVAGCAVCRTAKKMASSNGFVGGRDAVTYSQTERARFVLMTTVDCDASSARGRSRERNALCVRPVWPTHSPEWGQGRKHYVFFSPHYRRKHV